MNRNQLFAKALNSLVTDGKNDEYDTDNYLYASLTQPPIRIIDKNNSDDELDFTVECPNCGSHVTYGKDVYMIKGHIFCTTDGCQEKLIKELGL